MTIHFTHPSDASPYISRMLEHEMQGQMNYMRKEHARQVFSGAYVEHLTIGSKRRKHLNQQVKALRRSQAGKPSYRQRQASARASKALRAKQLVADHVA